MKSSPSQTRIVNCYSLVHTELILITVPISP